MPSKLLVVLAEESVGRLRGDRLRALVDAARDVAQGTDNPRLRLLAQEILNSARLRGASLR